MIAFILKMVNRDGSGLIYIHVTINYYHKRRNMCHDLSRSSTYIRVWKKIEVALFDEQ